MSLVDGGDARRRAVAGRPEALANLLRADDGGDRKRGHEHGHALGRTNGRQVLAGGRTSLPARGRSRFVPAHDRAGRPHAVNGTRRAVARDGVRVEQEAQPAQRCLRGGSHSSRPPLSADRASRAANGNRDTNSKRLRSWQVSRSARTRTGLAHSISYPLTGCFGLRHGLACSFTLPSVAAFVLEGAPERARVIAEAFGATDVAELSPALREWMERLGVYEAVRRVIDLPRVLELGDALLAKGRADNGLRPATRADAQRILREALSESPQGECTAPPRAPGRVVWITGLSGAGKSTLARALTHRASGIGTRGSSARW